MKKILGIALLAGAALVATPALAQHGGGGHGGGGGGGFHGGGFHGGAGFHGGGGFRGGYRGGYRGGFYGGYGFGFGCCYGSYYWGDPYAYYGDPYSYYYAPPYPPPDYDDAPPPPPPQDQAEPDQSRWHVTHRRGETDFELPDSVLFDLDSARVSRGADTVLNEIADAARKEPGAHLIVEGHTDTSGTRAHNQALSDARARAVADVLAREGVARRRIETEGLGENDLAVQTGDEVREPRNRRVVVRLISQPGAAREERDDRDDRYEPMPR